MNKIVEVKNLTKIYQLYDKPIDRLKEALSFTHKIYHKKFYALDDISFDVIKGESFGIIGKNGSGKSTLLKIVTGVLSKTKGELEVKGKVAALLELGAGFNMDYTGIENIYMNGTMMGYTKKEMEDKLNDIIEFADIGDAINRPVKEYSSGMFVRLAFALSITVNPDILIVDEALSVGDVFFQSKCYKRMEELKNNGTTIVMVTHDLGAVIKYCDRVLLLNDGKQISIGLSHEMVDLYKKILVGQNVNAPTNNKIDDLEERRKDSNVKSREVGNDKNDICDINNGDDKKNNLVNVDKSKSSSGKNNNENGASDKKNDLVNDCKLNIGNENKNFELNELLKNKMSINPHANIYGDDLATFIDFGIIDEKGNPSTVIMKGEQFTIKEKIKINKKIKSPIFTWTIKDKRGTELTGTNTMLENIDTGIGDEGEVYEVSFTQKMLLQGGEYLLSMSCTSFEGDELKVHHRMYDVLSLTVLINENKVGIFDSQSVVKIVKGFIEKK